MPNPLSDTEFRRRTVLRGIGAGAIAVTGLSASGGAASAAGEDAGDEPAGYLVLIYDDSPREDYTKAFAVHQEYDVPGCAAVCPGLMGTTSDWLHPQHLEEMHEAGWEVMSHTWKHRALAEIPVRSDIEAGDEEIHVDSNLHGMFEGDPLRIFDDDTETTATVAGRAEDGDDDLLILDEPIDESFAAGDGYETWVRYTDEFTEEILAKTKEQLEEWGYEVPAYVHTFNRADGYVSEVAPEFHDAIPNAGRGVFNPTFEPDPLALRRANFEDPNMSDDELAEYLDTIANEPDFGILYGHANRDEFTAERIETTIQMAQERDIAVVTLQEALIEFGVFEGERNGDGEADDDPASADDDTTDDGIPTDDTDPGGRIPIVDSIVDGLRGIGAGIRSAITGFFGRLRGVLP